jgi:hypothetical protein
MSEEHPSVASLRHHIKLLEARLTRFQAGEMPGVDANDGLPPVAFQRQAEIAKINIDIADFRAMLKKIEQSRPVW